MLILVAITGSVVYISYKVSHRFTRAYAQTQFRMITSLISHSPCTIPTVDSITRNSNERMQQLEHGLRLSTVALGLTTAGVFWAQPVGMTGALVVVYLDWPSLHTGLQALVHEKQVQPTLLHSLARILALYNGAYVLCAVDALLYHWVHRQLLQAEQVVNDQLTSAIPATRRTTWLQRADLVFEVPTHAIQPNDTVIIAAGELAPIDGIVTEGVALVNQSCFYETNQTQLCAVGDAVSGASLVLAGKVHVRVQRNTLQTSAACLAEAVKQAAQAPTAVQTYGTTLANQLAPPLLGLSALATLALGPMSGATLLKAQFGGDICHLAPLTIPQFIHQACQAKIWIKEGYVLEQLYQMDALIFALEITQQPEARGVIRELRARGLRKIYAVTQEQLCVTMEMANALGLDAIFVKPNLSEQVKLLDALRDQHQCLCYVGNSATDPTIWQYVQLSITCCHSPPISTSTAAIQLNGSLQKLCRLIDLARSFEANLTTSFALTLLPGFIALAGTLAPSMGFGLAILAENLGLLAAMYNAMHPVIIPTDDLYDAAPDGTGEVARLMAQVQSHGKAKPRPPLVFPAQAPALASG